MNDRDLERMNDQVRVRVFRFGDQFRQSEVGIGQLLLISRTADWDTIKRLLVHCAFGASIDVHDLDLQSVQIYLLPDGEEITGPGKLSFSLCLHFVYIGIEQLLQC